MGGATIRLENDLGEIERMNRWLAHVHAGTDEQFERIKLCLNEAVENTIRYGYPVGGLGYVDLSLDQGGPCITVVIRDDGKPYDPLARALPDPMRDLESATIGGFGILLMHEAATSLSYAYRAGMNVLTAEFCPRQAPK